MKKGLRMNKFIIHQLLYLYDRRICQNQMPYYGITDCIIYHEEHLCICITYDLHNIVGTLPLVNIKRLLEETESNIQFIASERSLIGVLNTGKHSYK